VQQRRDRVEQLQPVVPVVPGGRGQLRPVPPDQRRQPQQLRRRVRQAAGERASLGAAEQLLEALGERLVGTVLG
jgi:hypothetical protein